GKPKPAFDAVINTATTPSSPPPPVMMTAEQDHQRMMDLLHIVSSRPGANGSNPKAPNAANYDESKANPYPNLPDPLVLKNRKGADEFGTEAQLQSVDSEYRCCHHLRHRSDQQSRRRLSLVAALRSTSQADDRILSTSHRFRCGAGRLGNSRSCSHRTRQRLHR